MSRIPQLGPTSNGKSSPFTLSFTYFIKVRPTDHRSAVEMNQREVRMSILFKFKMFFKFTRYSTDYLHIFCYEYVLVNSIVHMKYGYFLFSIIYIVRIADRFAISITRL